MQSTSENHPQQTSKRRSTRIVQAVPLMLTGVDALGRPFQERTATQSINCHGARYQSKHYVLKNMWVTLEVPHPQTGQPPRRVRGRVTWIQRPRTVRELFQVAVELETPGNLWGIAFHPPDWIPFPENASADIPVMETALIPEKETSTEILTAESEPPDNLRVFPLTGGDPTMLLARQMARLVMEAKQQIQSTAREATSLAATEEARTMLSAVESQVRGAAEHAVQDAMAAHSERMAHETLERIQRSAQEKQADLLERWNVEVQERLAQIEREHATAFAQQLENRVHGAMEQTSARNSELAANEARIEESLRRLSQELAERAAAEERRIQAVAEEKIRQLFAHTGEVERSVQRIKEATAADATAAHEALRGQFDSERATAAAAWRETLAHSIAEAARHTAERLTQQATTAATQFDQEVALRISAQRQALEQVASQAQGSLESLRELLGRESAQAKEFQEQVEQTSRRMDEQAIHLDQLSRTTQAQLEEQFAALLAQASADLRSQADATVTQMAERLQPVVESAGHESLQRLASQFEGEMAPRMDRAKELIQQLASGIAGSEGALREHQQRVRASAEAAERETAEHLREATARIERELDEAGGTSTAKWLAELESKATETTHTTFEGLMKAAAWYEKKVQTQMQATLEKGTEAAEAQLRAKAGEISGIFAAEVDHYSRGFVELVQGQVNETLNETLDKARTDAQGLAAGALSQFEGDIHQTLQREHERFTGALGGSLEDFRTRTDSIRTHAESTLQSDVTRQTTEFRQRLDQELNHGVTRARRDLQAELAPLIEHLKAQRAQQESEFVDTLGRLGDGAVGGYRERLEIVSNSFLATTAATLNQRGQDASDRLVELSEQRLRNAAAQVFAGVGETLRQRLQEISPNVVPEALATEPNETGKAASGGSQT